jgi:acetolactate synthase regulatory subunit
MAAPKKKTKIGRIQQRILDLLKQNGPQSRLELLCAVYQYRHAAGNILHWSVLERRLLQQKKFDDATKLLERVLEYAKERGFPELSAPKVTFDDLEPQFPPEEIVVQHASGRVTNEAEIRAYDAEANSILAMFKISISGLRLFAPRPEPQYENPEVRNTHPWHVANDEIQPYLEKWSWREWQNHPEERMKEKDALKTQLQKLVNKAHASITRALKTLEQSGSIEMTPNGWVVRMQDVKTLPEDLTENAKSA